MRWYLGLVQNQIAAILNTLFSDTQCTYRPLNSRDCPSVNRYQDTIEIQPLSGFQFHIAETFCTFDLAAMFLDRSTTICTCKSRRPTFKFVNALPFNILCSNSGFVRFEFCEKLREIVYVGFSKLGLPGFAFLWWSLTQIDIIERIKTNVSVSLSEWVSGLTYLSIAISQPYHCKRTTYRQEFVPGGGHYCKKTFKTGMKYSPRFTGTEIRIEFWFKR